jgi:signal transduction histidine kinase
MVIAQRGVGIYVESNPAAVSPGDIVEISGRVVPGTYAPSLLVYDLKRIGSAPLPEPLKPSFEDLRAGTLDSQWVEVSGVVRSARIETSIRPHRLILDLSVPGGRVSAFVLRYDPSTVSQYVDAKVRVRGVCLHFFNHRGQAFNFRIATTGDPGDVVIEKAPNMAPFAGPHSKISELFRFSPERITRRTSVTGVVLWARASQMVLHDGSGSLLVRGETAGAQAGDRVEAAGFPDFEDYSLALHDAVIRPSGRGEAPPAKAISVSEALTGRHDFDLTKLEGTLRRILWHSDRTVLQMESDGHLFEAELPLIAPGTLPDGCEEGARLEASGISVVQFTSRSRLLHIRKAEKFKLLLRDVNDIRVLRRAPFWTTRRIVVVLCAVTGVLGLAVIWVWGLARRNAMLREQIAARILAETELLDLQADLERRVQERGNQLETEISARHEREAIWEERTRLARELHDSLEQTLAGLAYQLDASKFAREQGRGADQPDLHLTLASSLARQSQMELRRSLWDLRPADLENKDLAGAVQTFVENCRTVHGAAITLEIKGKTQPLPERTANHLFRIVQEAVSNSVKHGGGAPIRIALAVRHDDVELCIADRGPGFDLSHSNNPLNGHFGIAGMLERVRSMKGTFDLESSPGSGTQITVRLPLTPDACRLELLGHAS